MIFSLWAIPWRTLSSVPAADAYAITADTTLNIPAAGVLTNDGDVEGDPPEPDPEPDPDPPPTTTDPPPGDSGDDDDLGPPPPAAPDASGDAALPATVAAIGGEGPVTEDEDRPETVYSAPAAGDASADRRIRASRESDWCASAACGTQTGPGAVQSPGRSGSNCD